MVNKGKSVIYFRHHWLKIIFVVSGMIAIKYLFFSTATPPDQVVIKSSLTASSLSEKKDEQNPEIKKYFLSAEAQIRLEELYQLGESATPSDLRRIDFYERGGLISSTPEIMELSTDTVEYIKENIRLMEVQGYYIVDFVDDLNENASFIRKLKSFFKYTGASNYHKGLQGVNEYLRFSATDINNSLFVNMERIASETYGSLSLGRWSALKHIFEDPDLGIIRLNEKLAGPGGTTIYVLPEELNEEINGNPAIYTVEVTADGSALTTLVWVNGRNMYSMLMQRNAGIDNEAKKHFFELARSLPDPE